MNLLPESVNTFGKIFNFQRYAIHDGPGIRSVLFLSGCPLRCRWCCNPESYIDDPKIHREVSVSEVMGWIREDRPYYKNSKGGVTLSGGEPLLQSDFTKAVLRACRKEDIGTAIETCGEVPWRNFSAVLNLVDYYLFDVKQIEASLHEDGTGAGNKRIMDNLGKLSSLGAKICLRIPLIPGFNMTERFSRGIIKLSEKIKPYQVHLLPFHRLAKEKYSRLGISQYDFGEVSAVSNAEWDAYVNNFSRKLNLSHSNIIVGG